MQKLFAMFQIALSSTHVFFNVEHVGFFGKHVVSG